MTSNDQYHADVSRISKSGLDLIDKAPAKYEEKYLKRSDGSGIVQSEEKTQAMIDGSVYHGIVLEPHKLSKDFVVQPVFSGDGARTRLKEFLELNEGKQAVSIATYKKVEQMCKAIKEHPLASKLIKSFEAEKTITWIDPETKAPCKARLDGLNDMNYIIDLKSTEDARVKGFIHSMIKYRYEVQDAFYMDGCLANGIPVKNFIFIAQEKTPPYLVKCHFIGARERELGRLKYRANLETYMECKRSGVWPGYEETFNQVTYPAREFEKYGMIY